MYTWNMLFKIDNYLLEDKRYNYWGELKLS